MVRTNFTTPKVVRVTIRNRTGNSSGISHVINNSKHDVYSDTNLIGQLRKKVLDSSTVYFIRERKVNQIKVNEKNSTKIMEL